ALKHHLGLAEAPDTSQSLRAQSWDYAAVLLRFCHLVGTHPKVGYTPEELHRRALAEQRDDASGLGIDRDMFTGAFSRYHAARNFRLIGKFAEGLELAEKTLTSRLRGTGAEPRTAHFAYEVGAA